MKFLVSLAVLSLTSMALAEPPQVSPYCYHGQVTLETNGKTETKDVFLSLVKSGGYYVSEQFLIGTSENHFGGQLAGNDALRFNSNDDYIPGGNASYNTDVEFAFDSKGA